MDHYNPTPRDQRAISVRDPILLGQVDEIAWLVLNRPANTGWTSDSPRCAHHAEWTQGEEATFALESGAREKAAKRPEEPERARRSATTGHEQQGGYPVDTLGDDLIALLYAISVGLQALDRCLEQAQGPGQKGQKESHELLSTIRNQQRLWVKELRHHLGEHLLA
jgi:hypothetical protein